MELYIRSKPTALSSLKIKTKKFLNFTLLQEIYCRARWFVMHTVKMLAILNNPTFWLVKWMVSSYPIIWFCQRLWNRALTTNSLLAHDVTTCHIVAILVDFKVLSSRLHRNSWIQKLQNRAARVITDRKYEHGQSELALDELKWKPLSERRTHFVASLCIK
jgi:hypothetical protein